MGGFTHLHLHTEYSLLDGACRLNKLIDRAVELGQTSMAITDHGVMYGAVDFYKKAKAKGVKPIIGCEVYVAARTRFDKVHALDSERYHLVLLCKNNKGYENLTAMVSEAWINGFYTKPRVDKELLEKYSDTSIAKSYRYSLLAMVALIEKDRDVINKCIEEMETLVSQSPEMYIREAYHVISKYPAMLDAEENGDYAKMSELLELDDAKTFTLKKVSANYRLYKVATVAGLEEEAAKHRGYVIENGGDTFYKKELEAAN